MTSVVCRSLWAVVLRLPRPLLGSARALAGSTLLLVVIFMWVALLWTGWLMIFSSDAGAVVHGQTGQPADFGSRIYFTGFTLFTLGVGDYVPQGVIWKFCTAAASFSGLFLITLAITYLLSVLGAVTQKRQLAAMLHDLGDSPLEIVRQSWDGESFRDLVQRLDTNIWPLLHLHTQRHHTYPIIHY